MRLSSSLPQCEFTFAVHQAVWWMRRVNLEPLFFNGTIKWMYAHRRNRGSQPPASEAHFNRKRFYGVVWVVWVRNPRALQSKFVISVFCSLRAERLRFQLIIPANFCAEAELVDRCLFSWSGFDFCFQALTLWSSSALLLAQCVSLFGASRKSINKKWWLICIIAEDRANCATTCVVLNNGDGHLMGNDNR